MQILCSFPAPDSGSSGFLHAFSPQAVPFRRLFCRRSADASPVARSPCEHTGAPLRRAVRAVLRRMRRGRRGRTARRPRRGAPVCPQGTPNRQQSRGTGSLPARGFHSFQHFSLFLRYLRRLTGSRISASYAGACASTAHRPAEGTRGSPRHGSASPESPPHTRQAHPARKGAQQIPRPSRNP